MGFWLVHNVRVPENQTEVLYQTYTSVGQQKPHRVFSHGGGEGGGSLCWPPSEQGGGFQESGVCDSVCVGMGMLME